MALLTAAAVGCSLLFFENMLPLSATFVLYSVISIMIMPVAQNICAEHATEENSNSLMGFFQSLRSLGSIIGSYAEARIYTISVRAPFIFSTALIGLGTAMSFLYTLRQGREEGPDRP